MLWTLNTSFFSSLIQGLVQIEEGLRELEHAIVRQYREGENDLIETYLHHIGLDILCVHLN